MIREWRTCMHVCVHGGVDSALQYMYVVSTQVAVPVQTRQAHALTILWKKVATGATKTMKTPLRLSISLFIVAVGIYVLQNVLFNKRPLKEVPRNDWKKRVKVSMSETGQGNGADDGVDDTKVKPDLMDTRNKMAKRREHMRKACARLGMRKPDLDNATEFSAFLKQDLNLNLLLYNDKYKFITCTIFKCGYSNWLEFMADLQEPPRKMIKGDLSLTADTIRSVLHLPAQVKDRLQNYLKIVTVRHPLVRFLSGFRDKFIEYPDKFYQVIPARILERRRGDPEAIRRAKALSYGANRVTFPEFASYVTEWEPRDIADAHWKPSRVLSNPCLHDYDIIAKLETSASDMDYILRTLDIDQHRIRSQYANHQVTNNMSLIISFYRQLNEDLFLKVCQHFADDFEIFGYYRPKSIDDIVNIYRDLV